MIGLGRGVRIGRIGGTEVRLHWSLPLLWLVVATGAGPVLAREAGRTVGWTLGAAAGVLLSASVLAHEMGHALAARGGGVPVPRITLWMLGGLSELGARLRTPGRAVAVALAGPTVSAVLGGSFLLLAVVADRAPQRAVALVLGWFVLVSSVREGVMARAELAAVGRTVVDVCEPLGPPVSSAVTVHGVRAMGGRGTCPVAGFGTAAVVDLDQVSRGRPDRPVGEYAVPVAGRTLDAGADLDEALDRIIALGPGPVLVTDADGQVLGSVHLERLVTREGLAPVVRR